MKAFKKAAYILLPLVALGYYLLSQAPFSKYYFNCVFHSLTGLYCAGCGGTRAVSALLQGDFFGALHDNALGLLLLPAAFYFYLRGFIREFFHKDILPAPKRPEPWLWALLIVVFAFMIIRNIPVVPFTFLNPLMT